MREARRWEQFGETVFTEITDLANRHQAINLGQGFPNFDGPDFVKEAAIAAIQAGHGQYARGSGIVELVAAVAANFGRSTGIEVDPLTEVTVTSGCTEALAASMLALVDPGDEVVLIEPFYDSYPADVAMADGIARYVTLRPPDFRLDEAALGRVVGPRTRAIILNTPHNPTGRVFSRSELEVVAAICTEHDLVCVSDEVYEHLVYQGTHISIATLPGMWERTLTLSSVGKTFSLTGWKVGWAVAPVELSQALRSAHQFLTFATATPLQHGAAAALGAPDSYYGDLVAGYRRRRDLLVAGLASAGFRVFAPEGTYFVMADHTSFGIGNDVEFVRHMIETVGVAAIPPSAFYSHPGEGSDLVRFAFCKDEALLTEAIDRLHGLR